MSGTQRGQTRAREFRLRRDREAPRRARRALEESVQRCPRRDDALLLVSELVTNAVRHGEGDTLTVAVREEGPRLRVEVCQSGGFADVKGRGIDGGRGLRIVEAIATAWGVAPGEGEVTVWFEL